MFTKFVAVMLMVGTIANSGANSIAQTGGAPVAREVITTVVRNIQKVWSSWEPAPGTIQAPSIGSGAWDSRGRATIASTGVFSSDQVRVIRDSVFCPITYSHSFPDLRNAFGDGLTDNSATNLWNHFHRYALSGREPARLSGASLVFRPSHYLSNNSDLVRAFGNNHYSALQHFAVHGMREGRNSSPDFSVHAYRANYNDLRNAFGNQLDRYYQHYTHYGLIEGRRPK